MKTTTLSGNDEDLEVADCLEWVGVTGLEWDEIITRYPDWRVGQTWFNLLAEKYPEDANKLRGSFFDPFYKDTWDGIIRSLRFLLEN